MLLNAFIAFFAVHNFKKLTNPIINSMIGNKFSAIRKFKTFLTNLGTSESWLKKMLFVQSTLIILMSYLQLLTLQAIFSQ